MNKTLVILASCSAFGMISIAFAQGKPADKPAPAAAAAKPAAPAAAATGKPAAGMPAGHAGHEHGKPGDKPGMAGEKSAAGPAAAAAPALPPPPKPPAELDEGFKYFTGNWKCDTKMPAGSMGPGSPEVLGKSTVSFKKVEKGWYYQGSYVMKKTKTMPGYKGTFLISYQPVAKMFAITSSDDMGGAAYETSTGFAGDTITFVGEGFMMGQKVKIRETMTRGPDKGATHKYEADMGKGFQVMGEDSCKK
ncbi:MAG TPA: hypothetical protein VK509_04620 [Polyangiales bacterium]|nr:hypothetical protein [Polyangiales bacterium]